MPSGEYLGMSLTVLDLDNENLAYFQHCAEHNFHLQQCNDADCGLIRYPPGTACPWCSGRDFTWVPVDARGEVHSYGEVHHAIQPAFRERAPYMILLVQLDTQAGVPSEHEAIRVAGNLVTPDGEFAPPSLIRQVGIGTRMRMVYADVAPGLALPHWTIDEEAEQPPDFWRYPQTVNGV